MRDLVILLHGAWQGSWVWDSLGPALATAGWVTLAPDLPGNGADGSDPGAVTFDDHIGHVETLILSAESPVRLVAHSGAGVLATALAERHPDRIAGLVAICAMLLPSGVTFPEFTAPFAADNSAAQGIVPWLDEVPGGTRVPPDFARTIFYHDAPQDAAEAAAARLTVQGHAVRAPRVDWTADRAGRVPTGYIRCGADRSVLPAVQDAMCATRPLTRVIPLPTGHAPMLADPATLARATLDLLGSPG
jgi:pimeloyl-ACP methyl ester carboxylesterase